MKQERFKEINKLNVLKTKVMDWNAAYYGVSIFDWMDRAGKGIARVLNAKFKTKSEKLKVAFFCGTGNNGGDGFAAASYLPAKRFEAQVFLFGSPTDIRTEEAREHWELMLEKGVKTIIIDSASPLGLELGVERSSGLRGWDGELDIVVDCLLGTGIKGKLREPIASGVRLFNELTSPSTRSARSGRKPFAVAVDFPTKGIAKVDQVISMQFPKADAAEVVDLQSDPKFLSMIGAGEVKALRSAKPTAHKGDNGRLMIVGGSEQYHGALLYAVKTAAHIVDLVYVLITDENRELVKKLKSKTAGFISYPLSEVEGPSTSSGSEIFGNIDCVLIGPGMGKSERTCKLVEQVLKSRKRAVLDADALNVLDGRLKKLLNENHILTPHKGEFRRVFGLQADERNVKKVMEKYNCTIVLKGKVDIVANPEWGVKFNYTGNPGMTKGGTGDVLAGLIAGFFCKNSSYIAAAAGVFINGLAGDKLYEEVKTFYDAEDLLKQIPATLKRLSFRT